MTGFAHGAIYRRNYSPTPETPLHLSGPLKDQTHARGQVTVIPFGTSSQGEPVGALPAREMGARAVSRARGLKVLHGTEPPGAKPRKRRVDTPPARPGPNTRAGKILAILEAEPRIWTTRELADRLELDSGHLVTTASQPWIERPGAPLQRYVRSRRGQGATHPTLWWATQYADALADQIERARKEVTK